MHIHDLPDDILRLVFKRALEACDGQARALKAKLRLLAVCQRWRHLALPIFHSYVSIRCGGKPDRRRGARGGRVGDTSNVADDVEIASNLGLAASAGCIQAVKRVDIHVHYASDSFPGFAAVLRAMRTAAEEWGGVKALSITLHPNAHVPNERNIEVAEYEDDIRQTSAMLAATMPAVRHLSFGGLGMNPVTWEVYGRLAALYSEQLQSLDCRHPITVAPGCVFKQLQRSCVIHNFTSDYQHPRVDAAKLVSLSLLQFTVNHSWAPFGVDGGPAEIDFPNLRELKAQYWIKDVARGRDALHWDGHPWVLRFPALRKLDLRCIEYTCPLLEYAALPVRMDEVTINVSEPVLRRISGMQFPPARKFKIIVDSDTDSGPDSLVAVNRILECVEESEETELEVRSTLLPVVPEDLTCTSLKRLRVSAKTSVDTMLGLIRGLPSLVTLQMDALALSDIHEDISIPEPGDSCPVEPLATKLEELSTYIGHNNPEWRLLAPVAKYLLLRIPTLARFESTYDPTDSIARFVEAYSEQYPHLAGIRFDA